MDSFEKIDNLPEKVRDYFCSNDSRLAVEQVCFLYDVREEDLEKMAIPIGNVFLKDAELAQLPLTIERELHVKNGVAYGIAYELNKKMFSKYPEYFEGAGILLEQWDKMKVSPLISEEKAMRRLLDLEPWILEEEKAEKEEERKTAEENKKIVSIAVYEALRKYPKLGEQAITEKQLKLQSSSLLVKPSIKNWITDFHDAMGAGKHSPIDRGNYLFHSENGKNLSANERQKMAIILKSLDEQTLVTVDESEERIIFAELEEAQKIVNVQQEKLEKAPYVQTITTPASIPTKDVFGDTVLSEDRLSKTESFFSVPGSKPPIGSDSFHEEKKQDEVKIEKVQPIQNANLYSQTASPVTPQAQAKVLENRSEPFASPNNISFSSPQKLSTEQIATRQEASAGSQKTSPASPRDILDAPKTNQSIQRSAYHIGPTHHSAEQDDEPIFQAPASQQIMQKPIQYQKVAPVPVAKNVETRGPAFVKPVQAEKPAVISKPLRSPSVLSPYHIGHAKNNFRDDGSGPKINGNIIDLS